jgi:hypothetical protein
MLEANSRCPRQIPDEAFNVFSAGLTPASSSVERTMAGVMRLIAKAFGAKRQDKSSMTNRTVRLTNSNRSPQTRVEQVAAAMLSDKDQIPLSELAEQLAESLYRDELRYGGWAVDVGLLGSSVFVADALQELQAGDGDLWKIVEADEEQ